MAYIKLMGVSEIVKNMIVYDNERVNQEDKTGICDSFKDTTSNLSQKEHLEIQGFYHEKWGRFTKKLRRLTIENPSLPVVISPQSFDSDSNIDCAIAYVHEKLTGEPKTFYLPILEQTSSVLADTEFKKYPKTANEMRNTLKVYSDLLISKIELMQ